MPITAATVLIDPVTITVGEGVSSTQICVVCSELPEREIAVNLDAIVGTAQGTYHVEAQRSNNVQHN